MTLLTAIVFNSELPSQKVQNALFTLNLQPVFFYFKSRPIRQSIMVVATSSAMQGIAVALYWFLSFPPRDFTEEGEQGGQS